MTKKPNIVMYPTLIIGLGGTGTNVVRHVKQRLLRTWNTLGNNQTNDSELPALIQTMVVDTEPLTNGAREQPIYPHEYVFAGRFDATRLIQNKENHSYLSWWKWDEDSIKPGFIHNGAKQLRPIGRLAFHRNYVSIKNMLETKLKSMRNETDLQRAQERGFSPVSNYRLVYIVSSLCGGTGAGMFLDAAHVVRQMVGSDASIVGIFMMPSVFEEAVKADIQRRRIRANAYAALRELDHFHANQDFKVLYQSEQQPIPTTDYRAFSQIFLLERNSLEGRALSSKSAVEKMAAHMISMTAFSYLTKEILGFDVNVTDERSPVEQLQTSDEYQTGSIAKSGGYLSYSTFGTSSLVLPRDNMWQYFRSRATERIITTFVNGSSPVNNAAYYQTINTLIDKFINNKVQEMLGDERAESYARATDYVSQLQVESQGLNTGLKNEIIRNAIIPITERSGLSGIHSLISHYEQNGAGYLNLMPSENQLRRIQQSSSVSSNISKFINRITASIVDRRTQRQADIKSAKEELHYAQIQAKARVVDALARFFADLKTTMNQLTEKGRELKEYQTKIAEESRPAFDPLKSGDDIYTRTIYDLETSALGLEQLDSFIEFAWESVVDMRKDAILKLTQLLVTNNTAMADAINSVVNNYRAKVETQFDIRNIVHIQYGEQRTPNNRLDQLFGRLSPHARVDGDTYEYTDANQEQTRLVTVPSTQINSEVEAVFNEELRKFSNFKPVEVPYQDRIDACYIVHGLPVRYLYGLDDMCSQYLHHDFNPTMMHLDPEWYTKLQPLTEREAQYRMASKPKNPSSPAASASRITPPTPADTPKPDTNDRKPSSGTDSI